MFSQTVDILHLRDLFISGFFDGTQNGMFWHESYNYKTGNQPDFLHGLDPTVDIARSMGGLLHADRT